MTQRDEKMPNARRYENGGGGGLDSENRTHRPQRHYRAHLSPLIVNDDDDVITCAAAVY